MAGDPLNSLQTPAHRTSGDPQEFEWSFQIDHPSKDEMSYSDLTLSPLPVVSYAIISMWTLDPDPI
jgi:hypothetical protein